MSEFASLKSDKWLEAPCCVITPLLHPADVMVLRTFCKAIAGAGSEFVSSPPEDTSDGKAFVGNDK